MVGTEIGKDTAAPAITESVRPLRRVWGWRALPLVLAVVLGLGLLLRPALTTRSTPLAPDFTLPAIAGGRGSLALHALRGHPVLLNFFNSRCPPCIDEMPILRQTAQAYRARGVIVLGVATGGDTLDSARQFAAAQHLRYPVAVDMHQEVAWRYDVGGWPTSFFLDAQGRLRGQYVGPLDRQTVRDGLAQAGAIACARCNPVPAPMIPAAAPAASDARLSADVVFTPAKAASPFVVRDQQGRTIALSRLRGKVVALTFVSSICTEQCPLVGKGLSQVRHDLVRASAHLTIVAISVAPERDTAQTVRHFAALSGWQGADWHYLSAPRAVLARIWKAYGVYVGPPTKAEQDPEHYAGLYVIDPRGRLRAYYDVPFLAPRVAAAVRALLPT
jgi:cytochrome c biogenesis protein CcmG, thiol:disulfide interchange protein DsbE